MVRTSVQANLNVLQEHQKLKITNHELKMLQVFE